MLIALLRSDQPAVKEQAAGALMRVADGSPQSSDNIIAVSLRSDGSVVHCDAAGVVANLAAGCLHKMHVIVEADDMPLLVVMLRSGQQAVQERALNKQAPLTTLQLILSR